MDFAALLPIVAWLFPNLTFDGLTIEEAEEIVAALTAAEPEFKALGTKLEPVIKKYLTKIQASAAAPLTPAADARLDRIPTETGNPAAPR
jgi:hypothetical protein